MIILSIIDNRKANLKKSILNLFITPIRSLQNIPEKSIALVIGDSNDAENLGKYGAEEVYSVDYNGQFDNFLFTDIITNAAAKLNADFIVLPYNSTGKSLLGSIAVKMNASSISGVINIPEKEDNGYVFKKVHFQVKHTAISRH
ncbi:MAG: hypothetical protein R2771_03940 [Saprospiraceae bacterium]